MGYRLGVDLGTTFTAAAVKHGDRPELVSLGDDAPEVPTVVFLREDGGLVVGEVASSRGRAAPHRVAREFKRWLGHPTPVLLAGTPYSSHALLARVLDWVVQRVAEQEGGPADAVVVTHPANWGQYTLEYMEKVVAMADVPDAVLRPEPVAAAMGYASLQRLAIGDVVAVYDLGGGTFDSAVVTRTAEGFEVVGEPAGVEQLGGIDFDDALFAHVQSALGAAVDDLDPDDAAVVRGMEQLRQDCTTAKVRLSKDVEWTVPVGLPGLHTTVRVTRTEFEDLIRPALAETLRALRRALRSAGVEPEALSRVLLAGGSSGIPLVSEMLSADLGRPVALDAPPKHLVALGAALADVPAPPVQDISSEALGDTGDVIEEGRAPRRSRAGLPGPRTAPPGDTDVARHGASESAIPTRPQRVSHPRRHPRPRPRPGGRRPQLAVAAGALGAALLAVSVLGFGPGPKPAADLEVNGAHLTDGRRAHLDNGAPERLEVVQADDDVEAVSIDVLGASLVAKEETDGVWDLEQANLLVAGAVPAQATVAGEEIEFVLEPAGWRWKSVPVAAAFVALLLLLAFGESLLKPVRRGARATVPGVAALTLIGAGLGSVVGLVGWTLGPAVLSVPHLVVCAVLGAAVAACGLLALAQRGDPAGHHAAVTGSAPHSTPVRRRDGDDVPRGESSAPDSR